MDPRWRLYLDPDLLVGADRWETTTAAGVLLHGVGHLLREHAARAEALPGPHHHLAWNLAGDAEINDDLLTCEEVDPAELAAEEAAARSAAIADPFAAAE